MEMERKKVLVMDDEPDTQIFLTNLLENGGYDAVIAESGPEAIQTILDQHPDLIILNVIQYRDSNILLYRCLRTDAKLQCIPVIMLSNIDRKTFFHYHRYKNPPIGGALPEPDAYIVKPPEAEELLQLVHRLTLSGAEQSPQEIV
jgi:two-component system phosphate regulon response regulator PhoB